MSIQQELEWQRLAAEASSTQRSFSAALGPGGERFPEAVATFGDAINQLITDQDGHVGDGTKTAVILAMGIVANAAETLREGVAWSTLRPGLEDAAQAATAWTQSACQPAMSPDQVYRAVRTAALGDDEIAGVVMQAIRDVGRDGLVHIDLVNGPGELSCTYERGIRFPAPGLPGEVNASQAWNVACIDGPLDPDGLRQLKELAATVGPCICVCESVHPETADQATNDANFVVISTGDSETGSEDRLDVAIATGAKRLSSDLAGANVESFGRCFALEVDAESVLIPPGDGDQFALHQHQNELRIAVDELNASRRYAEAERVHFRLARLYGQVASIAVLETDMTDRRRFKRTCGGLHGGRAFIIYGGLPGGGCAYAHCAEHLQSMPQYHTHWNPIVRALRTPLNVLQERSGVSIDLPNDSATAFDLEQRSLCHWPDAGPIDSAGVVESAIRFGTQTALGILDRANPT